MERSNATRKRRRIEDERFYASLVAAVFSKEQAKEPPARPPPAALLDMAAEPRPFIARALREGVFLSAEAKKVLGGYLLSKQQIRPESRRNLWLLLADISGNMARHPQLYARLQDSLADQALSFRRIIEMDVRRTNPALTAGQKAALERVLCGFAKRNLRVGYCQGMNFVAEFLLTKGGLSEEQAFWFLDHMVATLGESYYSNLVWLMADMKTFSRLLRHGHKRLIRGLNAIGVDYNMVVIPWFITAFTKLHLAALKPTILDLFLAQGVAAYFRVSIVMFAELGAALRQFANLNEFYARYEVALEQLLDAPRLKLLSQSLFLDSHYLMVLRRKLARREWEKSQARFSPHQAPEKCGARAPFCETVRFLAERAGFEASELPLVFRAKNILAGARPDHFARPPSPLTELFSSTAEPEPPKSPARTAAPNPRNQRRLNTSPTLKPARPKIVSRKLSLELLDRAAAADDFADDRAPARSLVLPSAQQRLDDSLLLARSFHTCELKALVDQDAAEMARLRGRLFKADPPSPFDSDSAVFSPKREAPADDAVRNSQCVSEVSGLVSRDFSARPDNEDLSDCGDGLKESVLLHEAKTYSDIDIKFRQALHLPADFGSTR